ncbi:MAG TPA: hypothetical protein VNV43_07140 [Candidatus Acidoferrales bacterium]|nr:hypothetical protein [Candidatus Acidoferrales bacterium]
MSVSAGPDWTVWQSTNYELLPSGQIIPHIQSYEERATGLNFLNPTTGQLAPAIEEVDLLPDGSGAAATNGQSQVFFPNDLATGVIRVITPAPESLVLESRPVSIGYSDSTNYIEIASTTNSAGSLIATNEVLYQGGLAGHGIACDVLFVYRKSGLEQDVIFRSRPPAPEQFGLSSANTRLQVSTEFFNSPTPSETIEGVNPQAGLSDSCLSFGRAKMIQGRAFLTGDSDSAQIPTFKTWVPIDSTTSALVEQVPYNQVSASLATLPLVASADVPLPPSPGSGAARGHGSVARAGGWRNGSSALPGYAKGNRWQSGSSALPVRKVSSKRMRTRMVNQRLVTSSPTGVFKDWSHSQSLLTSSPTGLKGRKPGFCFDYIQITGEETNFVFRGDEAYFVSSLYYLYGKTTIEGGTIVKMNSGGQLNIDPNGTVDCQTEPYKPAIFTSYNENDVGDWWGSGSPAMGDVQTPPRCGGLQWNPGSAARA